MRRSDGDGAMTRRSFLRGAMVMLGAGASAALLAACGRQAPAPAAQQSSGPVGPPSTPRTVPPTTAPAPAAAAAPTQAAPAQTTGAAPPTAAPAAAAAAKPALVNNRVPLVRPQDPGPP